MNAASESCVTNMTGWITSRDGDFCDAFLQVCLTNEEFEQYSSELSQSVSSSVLASASSSAPSSPSRSARKRHHQAKVAHMRALILSDILEESDAIGGGVSGNGQDDLRKVLIKIILAWAEGCDCVSEYTYAVCVLLITLVLMSLIFTKKNSNSCVHSSGVFFYIFGSYILVSIGQL